MTSELNEERYALSGVGRTNLGKSRTLTSHASSSISLDLARPRLHGCLSAVRAALRRTTQCEDAPVRTQKRERLTPHGAVTPLYRRSAPSSERERREQHTPAARCKRRPRDAAKKRLFTVTKCELSSLHTLR